jgi:hypothetical protein
VGGLNGLADFTARFKANIDAIDNDFEKAVDDVTLEAMVAAEREMVRTINETPSALSPGKPNRVWTGAMLAAVDAKVTKRGRKRDVQAGWLSNQQSYFIDQENGTGIVPSGSGMHMLLNGFNVFDSTFRAGMAWRISERNK